MFLPGPASITLPSDEHWERVNLLVQPTDPVLEDLSSASRSLTSFGEATVTPNEESPTGYSLWCRDGYFDSALDYFEAAALQGSGPDENDFTVEIVTKLRRNGRHRGIFGNSSFSISVLYDVDLYINGQNHLSLFFLNPGSWKYIVVQRVSDSIYVFLDGELRKTISYSGPIDLGTNQPLMIGKSRGTEWNYDGEFAAVRVTAAARFSPAPAWTPVPTS